MNHNSGLYSRDIAGVGMAHDPNFFKNFFGKHAPQIFQHNLLSPTKLWFSGLCLFVDPCYLFCQNIILKFNPQYNVPKGWCLMTENVETVDLLIPLKVEGHNYIHLYVYWPEVCKKKLNGHFWSSAWLTDAANSTTIKFLAVWHCFSPRVAFAMPQYMQCILHGPTSALLCVVPTCLVFTGPVTAKAVKWSICLEKPILVMYFCTHISKCCLCHILYMVCVSVSTVDFCVHLN